MLCVCRSTHAELPSRPRTGGFSGSRGHTRATGADPFGLQWSRKEPAHPAPAMSVGLVRLKLPCGQKPLLHAAAQCSERRERMPSQAKAREHRHYRGRTDGGGTANTQCPRKPPPKRDYPWLPSERCAPDRPPPNSILGGSSDSSSWEEHTCPAGLSQPHRQGSGDISACAP